MCVNLHAYIHRTHDWFAIRESSTEILASDALPESFNFGEYILFRETLNILSP